ncbi:hypothetical protein LINGRAHAP2_LOCUS32574 [Linum grandiflorum]
MRRLRKELDSEKQAAREEAWAKVSALELEINSAVHDLEFERRRLKGARERIMLRETQLRAFYSTTEEISSLFAKQQQQLKAMQKTLEDEENYDNGSLDLDLNMTNGPTDDTAVAGKQSSHDAGLKSTSAGGSNRNQPATSNDEGSATEKHECDNRSQADDQNTQGEEFTSPACEVRGGGFGSNIDVDTAPALDGTEQVVETESPLINAGPSYDLNTMQLDETIPEDAENQKEMENTEPGGTMRTADLIASEVAGSWAQSTAPSAQGDNGSQQSRCIGVRDSVSHVAESQTTISSNTAATKRSQEYQALSKMIGIVAPDLKEQFVNDDDDDSDVEKEERVEGSSSSDTECCSDTENINSKGGGGDRVAVSDSETEGSDAGGKGDGKADSDAIAMDEDDETQVDSVS